MSRYARSQSPRPPAERRRRRRSLGLPLTLLAPALFVVAGPEPSASALEPECVQNHTVVVCTYTGPAGSSWSVPPPAGATEVEMLVIGQPGGNTGAAVGGRAARISYSTAVVGSQPFLVQFRNDGGLPGPGAGFGGGSAVVLRSPSTVLVHAAGGGGAGASSSNSGGFGGQGGGSAGQTGGNGSGDARGGGGATTSAHGTGGTGACITFPAFCVDSGEPGSSTRGGDGGNEPSTGVGGGGGGGGAFKGGGGGAGFGGSGASGAGGGGGSSLVPFGATFSADGITGRRVVLTFRTPIASVTPTSLAFGNVPVGTTSASQSLTVSNTGSAPLTVSNIGISGPYARTTTCFNGPIAPNASCTIGVTFSPSVMGASNTTLFVNSNSANGNVAVPITGTGVQPVASPTPSSLAFAPTLVGDLSATQIVTMRNTGNANLVITSAALAGTDATQFSAFGDTCTGSTLPANGTCTVSVGFEPTSTGAKTAQLRFTDNAANSPQNVALTGTGTEPAVSLPPSLDFGSLEIGATSAPMTATIQNTGSGGLLLHDVTVAGADAEDFVIGSHACAGVIPAGGSCAVPVSFRPQQRGARAAVLRFTDSAAGSPHDVALDGTAIALGDLQVRGPGNVFTRGQGSLVTLAVAMGGTAAHDVKVVNTSSVARSFEIALTHDGAASTAKLHSGFPELAKNPAGNYVTAVLQPGKSIIYVLKVKPAGPGQVTSSVSVHLVAANGAEHDLVRSETNIKAPTKGSDSFGLFAKAGSQPYVGGSVNGQTTTANSVALGSKTTFTVLLRNDGAAATAMTFKMDAGANSCWTTKATTKQGFATVDITADATGGGYLTKVLPVNGSMMVTITLTRVASNCDALSWQVSSYDGATQKHYSYLLANPAV